MLTKMRYKLIDFDGTLLPYACPIQTIQDNCGSCITDNYGVPYAFYSHLENRRANPES